MPGRMIYVHDDDTEGPGYRDLQVPVWSEDRQRWEARHVPISVDGETGAVELNGTYAQLDEVARAKADAAARGTVVDDFRDLSGWTVTNGTIRQVGTDRKPVARVTTTSGGTAQVVRDVNLDMRGRFLSFEVKALDTNFERLDIRLGAGSRSFGAAWSKLNVLTAASTGTSAYRAYAGRRQLVTIPMAMLTAENGATSLDNIQAVRIDIKAATGTVAEVEISDLRVHDQTLDSGVIFQFDDGLTSVYTEAFPRMQAAGIVGSVGVSPSQVGTAGFASLAQLQEMQAAGWEMIGHDTGDYTAKTSGQLTTALRTVQDYMRTNFGGTDHFVCVGGAYNEAVIKETLRHFRTARSVASDSGSRYETPYIGDLGRLRTLYINATITQATAQGWLDAIVARGSVSYLTFHDLVASSPTAEHWLISDFQDLLDYFVSTDLVAYTPSQVWPEVERPLGLALDVVGPAMFPDFPATADPRAATTTGGVGVANRCFYTRVRGAGTISKVGLHVATSSGNISVAAYRNTGSGRSAAPGRQLSTSGAVACPASGYAEVALGASVTLDEGDWLAVSADNTTATFVKGNSTTGVSNLAAGFCAYQDTAHPAPATPAVAGYHMNSVLLVGVT